MFGVVSNKVEASGYAALGDQSGSAVSPEAHAAGKFALDIVREAERSVALFGDLVPALSGLCTLVNECSENNWDASGAQPLNLDAVARAEQFLRALPNGVPMPQCSAEPDGSISLDWSKSRYRLFSISISGSDRLAFAWLDGSDKGHGVARFYGRVVPKRLLFEIQSTLGEPHAPLRAA